MSKIYEFEVYVAGIKRVSVIAENSAHAERLLRNHDSYPHLDKTYDTDISPLFDDEEED